MNYEEIAPCVFLYENVLDNSKELINLAEKTLTWVSADIGTNNEVKTDYRLTEKADIHVTFATDVKWFILSKMIWKYADHYGKQNDVGFSIMESCQMLKYSAGDGFYKKHSDAGPGMPRTFSCVLYLNDVEEGGETYFNKFNLSVAPREGRMILFPANYVFEHEARRPISNEKYVIVTWFRE